MKKEKKIFLKKIGKMKKMKMKKKKHSKTKSKNGKNGNYLNENEKVKKMKNALRETTLRPLRRRCAMENPHSYPQLRGSR